MTPTLDQQLALTRLADLQRPVPQGPSLLERLRALRDRA